jgi:hypothetical protein
MVNSNPLRDRPPAPSGHAGCNAIAVGRVLGATLPARLRRRLVTVDRVGGSPFPDWPTTLRPAHDHVSVCPSGSEAFRGTSITSTGLIDVAASGLTGRARTNLAAPPRVDAGRWGPAPGTMSRIGAVVRGRVLLGRASPSPLSAAAGDDRSRTRASRVRSICIVDHDRGRPTLAAEVRPQAGQPARVPQRRRIPVGRSAALTAGAVYPAACSFGARHADTRRRSWDTGLPLAWVRVCRPQDLVSVRELTSCTGLGALVVGGLWWGTPHVRSTPSSPGTVRAAGGHPVWQGSSSLQIGSGRRRGRWTK